MKKQYLLLSVFLFIQGYASVYQAEYWRYSHGESDIRMPSKLYFLHDCHKGNQKIHFQQSCDIFDFINKTNSSFISESPVNENSTALSLYTLRKRVASDHPFYYLSQLVARCGVVTSHVDFRSADRDPKRLKEITDRQIRIIHSYNDHPILTNYYKNVITTHQNVVAPACDYIYNNLDKSQSSEVQKRAHDMASLYNWIPQSQVWSKDELITLMFYYNTEIVNLEIVHAISEHGKQGAQSTVVHAGGAHLDHIKSLLTELGYRLHKSIKLLSRGRLLKLSEAFKQLEPEYDPNMQLPKKIVDYLLAYLKFERDHPHMAAAIPTTVLLGILGTVCYWLTTLLP